jgi:hypothetical protein
MELLGRTAAPLRALGAEHHGAARGEHPADPVAHADAAPSTCAGAVPRICRTLSWSANMPYMPVWV